MPLLFSVKGAAPKVRLPASVAVCVVLMVIVVVVGMPVMRELAGMPVPLMDMPMNKSAVLLVVMVLSSVASAVLAAFTAGLPEMLAALPAKPLVVVKSSVPPLMVTGPVA